MEQSQVATGWDRTEESVQGQAWLSRLWHSHKHDCFFLMNMLYCYISNIGQCYKLAFRSCTPVFAQLRVPACKNQEH